MENNSVVNDDSFEYYSNDDLVELLKDTLERNYELGAETAMFEKYFSRIDERGMQTSDSNVSTTMGKKLDHAAHRPKRSKSHAADADRFLPLTIDQKCFVAVKEINEVKEEIQKYTAEYEKTLAAYEAVLEESDICLNEITRETSEFNRDIVKGDISHFTNTIKAERCVQYFEERLKVRDALKEKLLLKFSTLKIKEKKLLLRLKQKEKIGEVLDEVDFDQLKIMHQQYGQTLSERSQDLLRLKLTAGNTIQVLNFYKKKVQNLAKESSHLQGEVTLRIELRKRIEAESNAIEGERLQAERVSKKLNRHINKYEVPTVMEYVIKKSEVRNMRQTIKVWERKLSMAEMAYNSHNRSWKKLKKAMDLVLLRRKSKTKT